MGSSSSKDSAEKRMSGAAVAEKRRKSLEKHGREKKNDGAFLRPLLWLVPTINDKIFPNSSFFD